jgi:hypothetical protein
MVGRVLVAIGPEGGTAGILGRGGDRCDRPKLPIVVQSLQLLRMLELLAGDTLGPDVRRIVAGRLQATMRLTSAKARRRGSTPP